jgi:hypothetical protein
MLVLTPDIVRFEDLTWEDCTAVTVSREASRLVKEWNDTGPHVAFVDVPERTLTVKVTRELTLSEPGNDLGAAIGRLGWLRFYTATGGSDAGRQRISVRCVLTEAITQASPTTGRSVTPIVRQIITFVGVSPDGGAADPMQIVPAVMTD